METFHYDDTAEYLRTLKEKTLLQGIYDAQKACSESFNSYPHRY